MLYSQNKTPSTSTKKNARHIPQVPERILDAPDLIDDYCKFAYKKVVLSSWQFCNLKVCLVSRSIFKVDSFWHVARVINTNMLTDQVVRMDSNGMILLPLVFRKKSIHN